MRNLVLITGLVLALYTGAAALDSAKTTDLPQHKLVSDDPGLMLSGQPILHGKARADTVYLIGGPHRDDGDFENATGGPSWDGWISHDMTVLTDSHWHIDNYNCANLDPTTPDNHAWWCGSWDYPSCGGDDPVGGYGNGWHEYLSWTGSVADNGSSVTVTVEAVFNFDTESGYDYLYLDYGSPTDAQTVLTYSGTQDSVAISKSFVLTPADYLGAGNDEVRLQWRFKSDRLLSDEDCGIPSAGAAQIDLISVFFDQGAGPVQIGTTEDCEGAPQWQPTPPPAVGDFSKVWPLLEALNAFCWGRNTTPVVAFIDDGVVVPGTGGYPGQTWTYGPGRYIVNPEGGLAGPDFQLHNEIWSPILTWPGAEYAGAMLAFDVYRHGPNALPFPGIYYIWRVRSTTSANPADLEDADWEWDEYYYFEGGKGPGWHRFQVVASEFLEPGCRFAQVALGVLEDNWEGVNGTDGTPAPYFDNVAFTAYEFGGPAITAEAFDLANDAFPESGEINYANASANNVRFDMARNISPPEHMRNDPGDSLALSVTPVRAGSVLNGLPRMYYLLRPNPLFDAVRTSGLPNSGFVYGDSARDSDGIVVPHRYSFDLPDTGFFFPGDEIHYYFEAQDNAGGDIGTTILPPDTAWFSNFSGNLLYDEDFCVRALPTLHSLTAGDQPRVLFWYDCPLRHGENEWLLALHNLGYQEGADYDLYYTSAAGHHVGNGLGGRATPEQLLGYETILYMAGTQGFWTISSGDFNIDAGDDVGVLDTWLRSGGKNMYLTGTHLAFDLWNSGPRTFDFLTNWISASFVNPTIVPLIDGQYSPLVKAVPGNSVVTGISEWIAFGQCRLSYIEYPFDAVTTAGSAELLAEFTDPAGNPGQYPYAAMTLNYNATYDANVIFSPVDLTFVRTAQTSAKAPPGSAARTRILEDVLQYFGHSGGSPATDIPDAGVLRARSYPNPFNPAVKIAYNMPRRGELTIRIFNVRGELVRTVINEIVEAGGGFALWDGTNARGEAMASGIYFYELKALNQTIIDKMALVK